MEDNITRQAEEIEVLCSIYGELFKTEDECNQSYSITISEGSEHLTLYITLPPEYPSDAPPIYQVSAPAMDRHHKLELQGRLESIFLDNIGENILYQWIEAAKEFLQDKTKQKAAAANRQDVAVEEVNAAINSLKEDLTIAEETPRITHGETITDRKSIFQGHLAEITSVDQVKLVLSFLKQNKKIANATHNIFAYRIKKYDQNSCLVQDCEDDGETAAGSRLLHLLQIMDVMNVLVVVSRWYGGVHLGPDRFRHINNAARQVLELSGLVKKK